MIRKSAEEIIRLGEELFETLTRCELCPQDCRVNRREGQLGKCGSTATLRIASANLHYGEEPPLSGGGGSGTIFFSNCSLFCKYCQNYPISQYGNGRDVTVSELKELMLSLKKRGADNINFVTPDHMLPMALMALGEARREGMGLPLVYNCSGYQKRDIIRRLAGIIDIYLVDMRYNDDAVALEYSGCHNYVATNRAAVKEMFDQVGNLRCDRNGIGKSGVIVRHLVLPNRLSGSAGIFRFLAEEVSPEIHLSLMSQYFPAYKAPDVKPISRRISVEEFEEAVEAFYEAGLSQGFIQELEYETA